MDGTKILFLIFCVLLIGLLIVGIHIDNEKDNACKALGLEDYEYANNMRYCEDASGNLYYVKMECKPWYWPECTAKPITVGYVRTVDELR